MGKEYLLPERLRARLARPLGRLYGPSDISGGELARSLASASLVASVGDRVTETIAHMGRVPDVQVVDGRENRKQREPPVVPHAVTIEVPNPAGAITQEAMAAVKYAFSGKKPCRVLVDGEEDLLALPVVVYAPLGTTVYYGQPGKGIVAVRVDHAAKSRSREVLSEMGAPGMR